MKFHTKKSISFSSHKTRKGVYKLSLCTKGYNVPNIVFCICSMQVQYMLALTKVRKYFSTHKSNLFINKQLV